MKVKFRDRIKELRRVPAKELVPHVKNWRRHPAKQRRAMQAALAEIGFANTVLAREGEQGQLQLIDGHLRIGIDPEAIIPVLILDVTAAEAEKILATLDPITGMADIDEEAWVSVLQGIDAALPEFQELLDELHPGPPVVTGLTDEEDTPETPESPVTQVGDRWILGPHHVHCGNSTSLNDVDQLMRLDRADLVHLDPPYGQNYGGGRGAQHFGPILNDDKHGDDFRCFIKQVFGAAVAYKKPEAAVYNWCSWRALDDFRAVLGASGLEPEACIVWNKEHMGLGFGHYRPQHELLLYCPGRQWQGGRDQPDVWSASREAHVRYQHPTQKPVALMERAILNSSKRGNIVMDLFGGSGSTLIACTKTGRLARLMELAPQYVDVIVKRWQAFTGQPAILAGDGRTFEAIGQLRESAHRAI
jgi:DNA modification methylase